MYDGKLATLVQKYSPHKILTFTFNTPITLEAFAQFGEAKKIGNSKIELLVNREKTNHVAAHILDKFDVDEFTVEEPSIEDVVREFFTTSV